MSRVPILLLVVAGAGAAGCVYYNAMWSAEQLAKEARRGSSGPDSPDPRPRVPDRSRRYGGAGAR